MTCEEKLIAIQARIDGEFDHPLLVAIGPLIDTLTDIQMILNYSDL